MKRRLRESALGFAPVAGVLLVVAAALSQPPDPPAATAPVENSGGGDAARVEADGRAAGDRGHSILDGLLPDTPPPEQTPPPVEPPPPPKPPVVPPPPPVIAAVKTFETRLGRPDNPAPPAEVRRVRHAIAQQITNYQKPIGRRMNESDAAAVRVLTQVGIAAAELEPSPPPERAPDSPPQPRGEITYGKSPTFTHLSNYVEPVSSAVAGPRSDEVDPINSEHREAANRIFGGAAAPAVPVNAAPATSNEIAESIRSGAARAFGEDAGVGSLSGGNSGTNFFPTDKAAPIYAASPYWRSGGPTATHVDASVVDARPAGGATAAPQSAPPPQVASSQPATPQPAPPQPVAQQPAVPPTPTPELTPPSPVNAVPRTISDLDTPPPPPPVIFSAPSGGGGGGGSDDLGGVRIGFSPAALRAAAIPVRLTREFERLLVAARTDEELSAALQQIGAETAAQVFGRMRSRTIGDVTTVSLKKLCDELEDHRRRGVDLPETIRRPGSLRRIIGYLVVPEAGDLLLLGSRQGSGTPLDVDDLIVALQTAWRDGDEPACSLDPNPHDFGGPQTSRILGVPRDSHFAAVMLLADYEMKRVLFGQRAVNVPGFVDLKTRLTGLLARDEAGSELQWLARFWFTPAPPRVGDVQTSPDGRVTIFDARMRLETETMEVRGNALGGTGRVDPILSEMMQQFMAGMAAMEAEVPEFAELQTLFDVVMLSSVLKTAQINHPVLARLAAMQHTPTNVPRSYPGLTTFIDFEGVTIMSIQGGVTTRPSLARSAIAIRSDAALEQLQHDGISLAGALSTDRNEPLALWTCESRSADEADTGALTIRQLIAAGEGRRAVAAATERLRRQPSDAESYLLRSEAYAVAGLYYLAERDLRQAGIAGADSRRLFILRAKIGRDRGDLQKPRQLLSAADLDRLVDVYFGEVAKSAADGDLTKAMERLDRADELGVKQAMVVTLRIRLLAALGRLEEARRQAVAATEQHPDDAGLWLLRAGLAPLDDKAASVAALASVNRAVELDPQSVDALLLRAKLRVIVDPLESDAAKADIVRARELAPNHPEVPVVQSRLAVLQGDLDGALAACNRAIRISPGYVPAYQQRLYIRSQQGESPTAFVANLRDCNTILSVKSEDWPTRMVRADLFTKLDDERLAELSRDPERMKAVITPIVVEHLETLTILPKLDNVSPEIGRDEALQRIGLLRLGFVEAAAADMEKAAAAAPPEIAARLRERAGQIRAALKPSS